MQQLNVLPVSISQGSDLKDESQLYLSGSSKGEDSFSLLVEQHVTDKSKTKVDNKNVDKIDVYKEKNSIKTTRPANDEINDDANNIVANADDDLATSGNLAKENTRKENQSSKSELSEKTLLDESIDAQAKPDFAKNIDLTESQKFISLLYTADKTLMGETNKTTSDIVINEEINSDIEQEEVLAKGNDVTKGMNQKLSASSDKTIQHVNAHLEINHEVINGSKATKADEKILTNAEVDKLSMTSKVLNNAGESELIEKQSKVTLDKSLSSIFNSKSEVNAIDDVNSSDIDGSSDVKDNVKLGSKVLRNEHLKNELSVNEKLASSSSVSVELKGSTSVKTVVLQPTIVSDNNKKPELALVNDLNNEADVEFIKFDVNNVLSKDIINTQQVNKSNDAELMTKQTNQPNSKVEFDKSAQLNMPAVDHLNRALNSQTAEQQISHQMKAMSQEQNVINQEINKVEQIDEDMALATEEVDIPTSEVDLNVKKSPVMPDVNKIDTHANIRLYTDVVTSTMQVSDSYISQQSATSLGYNIASDTVQIQKNNVLLQQETISIFRKDFAEAVKDKVMLVISQKLQQFDISLDPPELGNMQVRVNLQGEQAVVNFVVQNQQAKEALEQNMHKLRDMLSEQGVDVGDANVEQQAHQSSDDGTNSNNNSNSSLMGEDELIQSQTLLSTQSLSNNSANVIDYYA